MTLEQFLNTLTTIDWVLRRGGQVRATGAGLCPIEEVFWRRTGLRVRYREVGQQGALTFPVEPFVYAADNPEWAIRDEQLRSLRRQLLAACRLTEIPQPTSTVVVLVEEFVAQQDPVPEPELVGV